jgi:cytochrome c553
MIWPVLGALAAIKRMAMPAMLAALTIAPARADMVDMTGVEPWHLCGQCHRLSGSGNHIKFPRLAGQKPAYIAKQLDDFRAGRRENDGGQMQEMAAELVPEDIPRVADWFSRQAPAWPTPTLPGMAVPERIRLLATKGADGIPACLGCHSAASPALAGKQTVAPRIAGQWDYFIVKQLTDFRDGRRANDPDGVMRAIAKRLSDTDIAALATFLSQYPALHEAEP